ncbi:MAG: 50S ribosomal protein L31 [Deltaproteobacteria bacterium]|nr:50S ribosomal protein L31 [Deltaproteobacteria bacterium]
MKKDIHPTFQKAIVHCACGNEFETFSTAKEIKVEICSQCHPLFTGQVVKRKNKRIIDYVLPN